MAPKIERRLGAIFEQPAVKRNKDVSDNEKQSGSQNAYDQQQKKQDEQEPPTASRESVKKAVTDLQATDKFTLTGMKVEMVETKDGFVVRLTQSSGQLIKTMTAEEFIKLRDTSVGEKKPLGKILDQKF